MKIEVENISYSYGEKMAINDISAKIAEGMMVGIIGPNGSGKSTLLKCLSGVLKVRRGRILVNGAPLDKGQNREQAQRIAYVPQEENEPEKITVVDYMMLGRKPYVEWRESEKDVETVMNVAKRLGLEDNAMRNMDELSGGERQMARIGRALSQTPEVVVLDEPTSNLDMNHRNKIMQILTELGKERISVVMTLHDINMAFDYFTNIIMMKDGRIEGQGGLELATEEILSDLYGSAMCVKEIEGEIMIKNRRI